MAHKNSPVTRIEQVRPGLFYIHTLNGIHWANVNVVAKLLNRSVADTRRLSVKVC